jgi:DNA-binding NarL/FixJ family response regulator
MQTEQSPRPESQPPITVVLVDDEQLIRRAIAQALSSSGLELVGEAASGEDAIRIVLEVRPDVVLMDLRLPGISGVEAIEQLGLLAPASRVLVLTRSEENRVVEAIIAGASGYILKTAPPEAIISAVKATAAGESVLSPQVAGKLLQRIRELDLPSRRAAPPRPRSALPSPSASSRSSPNSPAATATTRSHSTSPSARTPSPTTSPASSPNSTSRTASKQPSKPYAAASPNPQRVTSSPRWPTGTPRVDPEAATNSSVARIRQ